MKDNFEIDEKLSTKERLKKLQATGIPYSFSQVEELVEDEWKVKTNFRIYLPLSPMNYTGLAAMSKNDPEYGRAALQYASTVSLGRAISASGIIDDTSVSSSEEMDAMAANKSHGMKNVLRDVAKPVVPEEPEEFQDRIKEPVIDHGTKGSSQDMPNGYLDSTGVFHPITAGEVLPKDPPRSTDSAIKERPVTVIPEKAVPEPQPKVDLVKTTIGGYGKDDYKNMTTQEAKDVCTKLGINFSIYPRRKTQKNLWSMVMAFQAGNIDEHLRDFCISRGHENIAAGDVWNIDINSTVSRLHNLEEVFDKPNEVMPEAIEEPTEQVVPKISEQEQAFESQAPKPGAESVIVARIQKLLTGWGEVRTLVMVGKLLSDLKNEGIDALELSQLTIKYNKKMGDPPITLHELLANGLMTDVFHFLSFIFNEVE